MAGWFSELVEQKVDVTETECVVKGDSICIFRVTPNRSTTTIESNPLG